MNFGNFLAESNKFHEQLLQLLIEIARKNSRLPVPTKYLDDGQDAVVFDTADPGIVVRVGRKECEYTMADPELQETGGVAKVYFITTIPINDEDWVVDWKEKVDLNVEGYLYRVVQKESQQMFDDITSVLVGLYHVDIKGLRLLQKYPITKPLSDAIFAGLPTSDLDVSHNLGINKKGCIVAYDC